MRISKVELGLPRHKVPNEYYFNKFQDRKENIKSLTSALSKEERYIAEKYEDNSLTLASKALDNLLVGVDKQEIGALFFVSQTSEYLFPTNAILLHKEHGLSEECLCMDMNANCAGMVTALEHAYHYMRDHKNFKYIVIAGGELHSTHAHQEDLMMYTVFADMGCALLLERTKEDCHLITRHTSNSTSAGNTIFPREGLSKIHEKDITQHILWNAAGATLESTFAAGVHSVKLLMDELQISTDDICFIAANQQTQQSTTYLLKELQLTEDKAYYIGDKYGYTGSTAAFVSFYHALNEGKIKNNKYIVFVTAGVGGLVSVLLMKIV